jgi:hypothetical protein
MCEGLGLILSTERENKKRKNRKGKKGKIIRCSSFLQKAKQHTQKR